MTNPKRRAWALGVGVLLVVGACSGGARTSESSTTAVPTAEPSTTAVPTAEPSTSGSADDDSPWGPLAVVRGGNGMDALIQGTIRITDECVSLDERGELVLLVWPSDKTQWDDGSGTIQFFDPGLGLVTIADGQEVRLGGGGTSVDEGGLGAQEWVDSIVWIEEPPASCVTDTRWAVSGVLN
ncbi:MAG: hypothetical protein GXP36_03080 [Actinobacteria bacterium]|nr:hypothetical protein [Actinomycetota bacterium]